MYGSGKILECMSQCRSHTFYSLYSNHVTINILLIWCTRYINLVLCGDIIAFLLLPDLVIGVSQFVNLQFTYSHTLSAFSLCIPSMARATFFIGT